MTSTIKYGIFYKFGKSGGWSEHSSYETETKAYDMIGVLIADDIKHGFTSESMDTYYYKVLRLVDHK